MGNSINRCRTGLSVFHKGLVAWFGAAICVGLAACVSAKSGTLAKDAEGRFSYKVASGVIEDATDGSYRKYRLERSAVEAFIAAVDAPSEAEGIAAAFGRIGTAYGELEVDGISSYNEWRLWSYAAQEGGRWKAAATQYRRGTLYAFIVTGDPDVSVDSLPSPIMDMLSSFRFTEKAGEIFAPASLPELERYIDAAIEPLGGAVSIAAIRDGEVIYRFASGFLSPGAGADTDAVIHWGSITKLVTATAIMREVERGRIDLDAPIDRYLQAPSSTGTITVRDLLSHASGLPEEPPSVKSTALVYYRKDAMPPLEDIWNRYVATPGKPLFKPGNAAAYNNFNYLALGVILEKTTGRRLSDYAETEILEPLGMRNTVYFSEDLAVREKEALMVPSRLQAENTIETLERAGYPGEDTVAAERDGIIYFHPLDILSPWGGLKGNAEDAARFGWMFLDGRAAGSERILSPKTIAAMGKARTAPDGTALPYGFAFRIFATGRESCLGHDGGGPGIESALRIYPRQKLVIAVLGSTQGYGAGAIAEYLKNILTDRSGTKGVPK